MSTSSSSLSRSQVLVSTTQMVSEMSEQSNYSRHWNESKQPPYQLDQRVKFLHLAAEVESLLQQLQSMRQKRLTTVSSDPAKVQQ